MTKLQDFLNSPVRDLIRGRVKAGDVFGIELECEGRNIAWRENENGDRELLTMWAPHADGSLRNHHGQAVEWVFNGPATKEQSVVRVNKLFDFFQNRKAKLVTSNRTSTHVHYNMGDKNGYQVVNAFILFTIIEGLFGRYCGEDRDGNLFCLSSRHAEAQVDWMMRCCFKDYSFVSLRNEDRYCSFNVAALNKFGTVEFRGMRGLDNREDMLEWLDILAEFCDYACYKMRNPVDIIQLISEKTAMGFLKEIFSEKNVRVLTNGLTPADVSASVYEGLRLVQMLSFKIGTEFDQVRLRGRDFWAGFNKDNPPELDIDPEVVEAGIRAPRNPWNMPGNGRDRPRNARIFVDDVDAFNQVAPAADHDPNVQAAEEAFIQRLVQPRPAAIKNAKKLQLDEAMLQAARRQRDREAVVRAAREEFRERWAHVGLNVEEGDR